MFQKQMNEGCMSTHWQLMYFLPFQMHQHYLNVEEREVQRDVEINFDKLAELISEEVSLL